MATTERAVFAQLLTDLKAVLNGTLNADHVYIRASAGFDADVSPPYAQLIPGSAVLPHPETGIGEVRQQFEVALFVRLALDEMGRDTGRITHASLGLLYLRNKVRGDGDASDPTGLIHRRLAGDDTISPFPHVLLSWSDVVPNPADPYWVMVTDTYRVIWNLY